MRILFYIVFSVFGFLFSNATTVINPKFDRLDVPAFHISKVEVTKDTTFVHCIYSARSNSWAYISHNTFLRDTETGKKFPIYRSSGIPFGPQKRTFAYDEQCEILFCFPSIKSSKRIDFIENENEKAFNVYGIDMEQEYDTIYRESDLARFSNMASFYDAAGDTIKAIQFKEKVKDVTEYIYGIKSEPLLLCMLGLSIMYDKYSLHKEGIDLMEKLTVLHTEIRGKADWNYALQLRNLATFYSNAQKYDLAIKKDKEAIALFESLGIIDNEYALALGFISHDYYYIGDFSNSFLYQERAIRARKHIKDVDAYINELYNTLLYTNGGKEDIIKRIGLVDKGLLDCTNLIDSTSLAFARLYRQMAFSYSLIDDNNNANKYCDKALAIMDANKCNDNEDYAELLGLKCKYQQRNGLIDEVISSGIAAIRLYESLNIRSLKYAELLGNLAWVYALALNFEKSVQLQMTAAGIYENAKDWISLAEVYNSISDYYQRAENLDDAERYIKKAIDVLNEHDNAQQYINKEVELTGNNRINNSYTLASINQRINTNKSYFHQTLARIYQKKGDFTNAIITELKSGAIIKSMGDDQLYALHLWILSQYYLKNHQLSDAIVCAENSIQLFSDNNSIILGLPKLQLAIINFEAGDTIKAIHYAEESVYASKSFDDKESWISTESIIAAQSILSYFYWKKHDYGKAEQCLSEELDYLRNFISKELSGMTTEQKQRLWGQYESNYLMYRNVVEKSNRNDSLLSKFYDYVLFSKNLLLDADIQKDAHRMKITWKEIQQQMSDEDIAIEFISTIEEDNDYNAYHALVIDKNNPSPKMITLISETELEKIKKTTTRNMRDIVGELIWKPILAQYSNAKNIYFSPDGVLHILPIEYYNVNSTTNMFEQYNMYRLSSTKELVDEHNHKQFNSAVLYGGLDYNQLNGTVAGTGTKEISSVWRGIAERGGFDPLFNTLVEAQEIKDLLEGKNVSTTLYTGEEGTEESFRHLSNQNANIIHLATHGMYVNPDGVEKKKTEDNFAFLETLANINDPVKEDAVLTHSFLVMAGGNRLITRDSVSDSNNDGILTSQEISLLDLRGLDLVVLSACESALGDIDNGGVYGLQRGFKKAGANTILMSLDKVDDDATKLLMVEFYKNLISGKSKHQSLKDAQKFLRSVENGKYDNPRYWASFIMLDGLN